MIRRLTPLAIAATFVLSGCNEVVLERDVLTHSTTTLDSAGGEARSTDDALTLSFEAGALSDSVDITIERVAVQRPNLVGDIWELGPDGLTFADVVNVEFAVDNPTGKMLVLANADGDTPVPVTNFYYDEEAGVVGGQLEHFSSYGAFSGIVCATDADCASGELCQSGRCEGDSGTCGNGIVEAAEACDDGNSANGDGCENDCSPTAEICNNGFDDDLDGLIDEGCSGGCTNNGGCDDGDACTIDTCVASACTHAADPSCFDCVADSDCDVREVCVANECIAPCDADSQCGSGEVCSSGVCVPGGGSFCGDGIVDGFEECDDGNSDNTDGCAVDCTLQEICGNGFDDDLDGFVDEGCGTTCADDNDCDDGNPCTESACVAGACEAVNAVDGTACDDGSACTTNDTCSAGSCGGTNSCGPQCASDNDCGGAGEICWLGTCEVPCVEDADCPGSTCDGDNRICI